MLSPQLTTTVHGLSFAPGSVKEPRLKLLGVPSDAVWSAGAVRIGATFFTLTSVVYSV